MTPIRIADATHEFGPPKGWNPDQHGGCSRLVTRVVDGVWQSAWEPTPAELAVLVAGGHVVLSVVGGQPPVALGVEITTEKEDYR